MIIVKAPLRVSFFGGGTDFPEYFQKYGRGVVLGTAINKYTYVFLNRYSQGISDKSLKIAYSQIEIVDHVEDIVHPVYRECLKNFGISSGVEIHTIADLPAFTGLGSSSSFTVALIRALSEYTKNNLSNGEIAQRAISIERDILRESVGCQDQTIAAVGGFGLIEFNPDGTTARQEIVMSQERALEFQNSFTMVYTGIQRRAAKIESEKIGNLPMNLDALSKIGDMAYSAKEMLERAESFEGFGRLFHDAWVLKKTLSRNVSNTAIDEIYNAGIAAGAWGGKLLGAGAGGFLLFCHSAARRIDFRSSMNRYQLVDFGFEKNGVKVLMDL